MASTSTSTSAAARPAHRQRRPSTLKAADVDIQRAYVPAAATDGLRVLVDRLWPRGVRKADAAIDLWLKDIAPSTELRKRFGHDPERWPEFRNDYAHELRMQPERVQQLRALAREGHVTLVYGAHDEQHNQAVVLRAVLLGRRI